MSESPKTKFSELPEFLPDEESIAAYLTVGLEENNPTALGQAQVTITRARGMNRIDKPAG